MTSGDERQIATQKRLAMTDSSRIAAQKKLAMTDSMQIAALRSRYDGGNTLLLRNYSSSAWRYWRASARCSDLMSESPARSAMVLANFRTR